MSDDKFTDGCDTKTCDYFSACETDKDGTAQCVCAQSCPKVIEDFNYT